jgi:hypothetical protein
MTTKLKEIHVTSWEKAFDILEKHIPLNTKESTGLTTAKNIAAKASYTPPVEATDGPWTVSKQSLQVTLRYVMEHLNHACYVLCVAPDGRPVEFIKLENAKKTPQHLVDAIAGLAKDGRNKKHIDAVLKKPYRVMQCILKPLGSEKSFSSEYANLLADMRDLPPGVFLLNLTDAVLLRKDGGEPFANLFPGGRSLPSEYSLQGSGVRFLPILSTSGAEGYWDVTIPTYDDVGYVLQGGAPGAPGEGFITEWSQKTIAKAVFRGGPSGCGWSADTNQRIKLADMVSRNAELGQIVDAGIVSGDTELALKFIKSGSVRVDANGVGRVDTQIPPVGRLSMVEQSRYKYIIHVDGNVQAGRLLTTMRTGSLILRVKGAYTAWLDSMLKEGVHYVGIKADLSNLEEKVRWCLSNDAKCRKIAANSLKLALQVSSRDYMEAALRKTLVMVATAANAATGTGCRPLLRGKRRRPQLVQRFYETGKSPYVPSETSPPVTAVAPVLDVPKKEVKTRTRKSKTTAPVAVVEKSPKASQKSEPNNPEMPEFIQKVGAKCPNGYEKYPKDPSLCRRKTAKKTASKK